MNNWAVGRSTPKRAVSPTSLTTTDEECLEEVRRLLSFLPQNNGDDAPYLPLMDPVDRTVPELREIVPEEPSKPYDMKDAIRRVVDQG